jgi:hypothetical protein
MTGQPLDDIRTSRSARAKLLSSVQRILEEEKNSSLSTDLTNVGNGTLLLTSFNHQLFPYFLFILLHSPIIFLAAHIILDSQGFGWLSDASGSDGEVDDGGPGAAKQVWAAAMPAGTRCPGRSWEARRRQQVRPVDCPGRAARLPLFSQIEIKEVDGVCPSPSDMARQVATYLDKNGFLHE